MTSAAVAVELAAPLVRTGTGTTAAASSSPTQRAPFPRRRAAGAIRASPSSGRSEGAGELPAPLLPNARRRGRDPLWNGGGFSLGVDLGDARTGLAVGRGITLPRPLTVLKLRGQKLELTLLDMARQQEADELIIGLPVSADGRETPQSNKVRSLVGRLAVQAAERGLRVYLQDEHGTSVDALDYMISRGVKKFARDVKSDAYAAVMILERYFTSSGHGAKIVLPRQPELQDKLIVQSRRAAEI
ncbi:hypothetical protein HU200_035384 [Digitaria exilis]|uniref:YqgF/RNase H-like domain-containing protein n=1 Tax=Digitaria exilis TaxID=1010633 RepID=A0A835EPE0_9POAL|nr:hypothetical protein HU200_035384 [Digitaria exilis]CAB3495295.1 unnamed protein product [Digitaria exilis]